MENSPWVKCFSVVTFDEDLGQKVELQVPEVMTEDQQQALAFLAFPDSNSFNTIGSLTYVFKMKCEVPLFGYVYFCQKRDPSKSRKFFQKSLVLLSEFPYISLFKQVIELLGPLYFDHGDSIFDAVNSCLKSWGTSQPGQSLELPMLGTVITFTVPSIESPFIPQLLGDEITDILDQANLGHPGLFQDINIFEIAGGHFAKKYLWRMWEIIVCGESLLLITDSPESCSLLSLALISLISPLMYAGESFPYFTIFDSDFRTVQSKCDRKVLSDIVIGATNPFILKSFSEIQNVFQFEERNGLHCVHSSATPACILPNKNVTTTLFEETSKISASINNNVIRKHFRELTLSLLQPFEQYLVIDSTRIQESPYSPLNSLKEFSEKEFLSGLNNSQNMFPMLKYTTRPKALSIYSRFLKSSTFIKWFASQRQKANGESDLVIRNAMFEFDISKACRLEKSERKAFYDKIQGRLMYEQTVGGSPEGINKLKSQLEVLGKTIARLNGTI